jgi:hypothetical protein
VASCFYVAPQRLGVHNQILLTNIKKIKNDKKLLEDRLEQLSKEKVPKSSSERIQVKEKGKNTNSVLITTQEDGKLAKERTYPDVGVQMMEITSVNLAIKEATSTYKEEKHTLKLNQEYSKNIIQENNVIRTPYRHPNHKSKHLNELEYQCHSGRE